MRREDREVHRELGELKATLQAIKENTDKIPSIAERQAVHEEKLSRIVPMVDAHERTHREARGAGRVWGIVSGIITSIITAIISKA